MSDLNSTHELVTLQGDRLVTTSLRIAEFTGKEHKHVMRDIKALLDTGKFDRSNFGPISYKDSRSLERPAYECDRRGTAILMMGFTGERALDWKITYDKAFEDMARRLAEPPKALTTGEMFRMQADWMVAQEQRMDALEARQKRTEALADQSTDFVAVTGFLRLRNGRVEGRLALDIGREASKRARERGIELGSTPHERWGSVNTYPEDLLEEVCRSLGVVIH